MSEDIYTLPSLHCKRCKHTWFPRSLKKPKVCPKCNSPYWNKERIKKPLTSVLPKVKIYEGKATQQVPSTRQH